MSRAGWETLLHSVLFWSEFVSCFVLWFAVDFVTPLKKRRLARESLSVDGSLRSISEEEDSPSARTASPPDALRPTDASSSAVSFTVEDRNANEYRCQVVYSPNH